MNGLADCAAIKDVKEIDDKTISPVSHRFLVLRMEVVARFLGAFEPVMFSRM